MSSTEVVRPRGEPTQIIQQYTRDFAAVLPSHIKPEQWIRLTTGVFRRNPDLMAALQRNPGSVLSALLDAARLGLEVGDTYHLVPFGGEIEGIADYTGLIELMYRAGAVTSVKAEIVYSNDHFEYNPGRHDRPDHQPSWFGDRGQMIGAYAYALMRDGSTSKVVVRSKAEIERVRDVSKSSRSAASPWKQWPDRMWLKTVIRELSKFVPTSAEYMREQLRAVRDVAAERPTPGGRPERTVEQVIDAEYVEHDVPPVDPDTGEVLDEDWPPVEDGPR